LVLLARGDEPRGEFGHGHVCSWDSDGIDCSGAAGKYSSSRSRKVLNPHTTHTMALASVYLGILFAASLCAAYLALYAWKRRGPPGVAPFATFVVAIALYLFGYTFKLAVPTLEAKLAWTRIEYLGVAPFPALWLILVFHYVGRAVWLTRPVLALLALLSLGTLLVSATLSWHELLYIQPHLEPHGPFLVLRFHKGPWYLLHVAYISVASIVGLLLLLGYVQRAGAQQRRQALLMASGTALPWPGYALYLSGYSPWGLDTAAPTFAAVTAIYAWALFRHRLFNLIPIARHALVDSMTDAMMVFDQDRLLVDCNRIAYSLFDTPAPLEKPAEVLFTSRPAFARAMDAGGVVEVSGAASVYSVSVKALVTTQGDPAGTLVLLHDITALKQVEEGLRVSEERYRALSASLQQRVDQELEKRLEQERLFARQARHAAMGEMLGAVAHQWRQPLTTLGVAVQLLKEYHALGRLDSAVLDRQVSESMRQIQHMSDTIDEFRRFYRPDREKEPFNVHDKVLETVRLIGPAIAHVGIELAVTAGPDDALTVHGFPNEFKQALLNLIANGQDAILDRRASQQTAQGPDRIVVAVWGERDTVLMEVSDNGCGIPQHHRSQVYDPYFTTKPDGKGTGLGLYITRAILVDSMGGELALLDGELTVFRVTLPRALS
jgi:signal transduction histidine kinase